MANAMQPGEAGKRLDVKEAGPNLTSGAGDFPVPQGNGNGGQQTGRPEVESQAGADAARDLQAALDRSLERRMAEMKALVLEDVAKCIRGLAFGQASIDVQAALSGIQREIAAVRKNFREISQENEELKQLQAEGFLKFAVRVSGADFQAFAVILALGNRKAAADFLAVPHRSFYDRVKKWSSQGPDYRRMLRCIEWRKAVGRKLKVRLDGSVQSGEPGKVAENPQTIGEVLSKITQDGGDSRENLLREVLGALENQNGGNWQSIRKELVGLIKEEVPQ